MGMYAEDANPPKSNITNQERQALKDLSSNKDIVILPADKGKATVALKIEDYKEKPFHQYTPVDQSLDIVKDRLHKDTSLKERTNLTPDNIIELLSFILTATYFQFNDQVYRQKLDAAMDSPVSPIVANLFMEDLGQNVLSTAPTAIKPRLWKRYVDDILAVAKEECVDQLKDHLNQADVTGSIKFTHEMEESNSVPFLDTRIITHPDGKAKLVVYRKKAHTGQYLNFSSHHPLHQKLGVYRTLMDRAHGITTDSEDVQTEEEQDKSTLRLCGYPDWSFRQVNQQMTQKPKDKPKSTQTTKKKCMVTIPYVKGTS
ncbi:uncharacterized protein [Diadema antillarum]|uniref:uncharacterized protein n=1 Tax=Diadema antillarum TaxID=105358 RepID=UPI003A89E8BB